MITDKTYAQTAKDVSQYAAYLFSPKPGHEKYIEGERVLGTSTDMLMGDPKAQVADLLQWNLERRPGKKPPKNQAIVGSIAFHPEDKLTPDQAIEITRKAVHKVMGNNRPVVYVAHGDTEHLHVHFIAATVDADGKVYAKAFDFRDWEHANEELEIEYQLTRVMQRKSEARNDQAREVNITAPTNQAMQMAEKGILTPKEELRGYIDAAYATGNFSAFLETLDAYGVRVKPNIASTGAVSGLSFALPTDGPGQYLKASDFGKTFAWKKLSETLNYEQDRHLSDLADRKRAAAAYDIGVDRSSGDVGELLAAHRADAHVNAGPVETVHGAGASVIATPDRGIERSDSANSGTTGRGPGDVGARSKVHDERAEQPARAASGNGAASMGAGWEIVEPVSRSDEPKHDANIRPGIGINRKDQPQPEHFDVLDRLDSWDTADRIHAMASAVKGVVSAVPDSAESERQGPGSKSTVPVEPVHSKAMQSLARAKKSIEEQIRALGRTIKDVFIGTRGDKGMKSEQPTELSDAYITHLRGDNAQGKHIYVRPKMDDLQRSDLILLDDMTLVNIDRMKRDGIPAACVIETSPNNYQAWVRFEKLLLPEHRTNISRHLSHKYHADTAAVGNDRWGRLAGFTNVKPERRLANGHFPFVQVRDHAGSIVSHSKAIELYNLGHADNFDAKGHTSDVTPSKGVTADSAIAKEFKRLYEVAQVKQKPAGEKWGASEWDFYAAIELLKHHHPDDVAAALVVASPDVDSRKGNYAIDYAALTITNASKRLQPAAPTPAENTPAYSRGDALKSRVSGTVHSEQGRKPPGSSDDLSL